MKRTLLSIMTMVLLWSSAQAQDWVDKMNDPNASFKEVQDAFNSQWRNRSYEKGHGYKQFKRWEYYWSSYLNEDGKLPQSSQYAQDRARYFSQKQQQRSTTSGNWTLAEPTNKSELDQGVGRVQWVTADPNNANILWIGTPAGGLWKSTDAGQNWTPKGDNLPSMGVSGIVIDPNNSNIMYISTGDPDGRHTYSFGVLKSTDGGNTWNSTGLSFGYTHFFRIYDLRMHPTNSQILFAATSTGIWRTTNGGTNWNRVYNISHTSDIEFHPTNPDILYFSNFDSVYKSTNGGTTWSKLTNGLPTDSGSRIELAVTKAKPDYLYVIAAKSNNTGKGIYRSTDGGSSFTTQTTNVPIGSQAWWDLCIAVSPTNADEVYIGGVYMYKSTNGGQNFSSIGASAERGGKYMHADHHNIIWIGNTIYSCNDGGLYKSTNNGAGWFFLGNGLDIMQLYRVSTYKYDVNYLTAGSQDNGTSRLKNGVWKKIQGADGMNNIISYDDPNVIYTCTQNGGGPHKSTNGGESLTYVKGNINESGEWVTPYIQNAQNPNTLYAGFQNVWKTTQGGTVWTKISNFVTSNKIHDLAQSESDNQTLWFSRTSQIYKTTNEGGNWTQVTIPYNYRSNIAIDPANPNRVWIANEGTSSGKKVYKTVDGGATWTNVSGGLPNIPVKHIIYQKGSNDAIYIATDYGVFFRDNTMSDWKAFNGGLPNTRVDDIEINYGAGKIVAATYGRGVWISDLHTTAAKPVADFKTEQTNGCKGLVAQFKNFSPNATSYSWSFPGGTPSTSTAANPSVTYNTGGSHNVTLTVTNANGSHTITKNNYVTVSGGLINSFPYTENFDSFTVGTPGTMQNGWMNDTTDNGDWFVHKGVAPVRAKTPPANAGPNTDHTSGNGNYLLVESSQIGNNKIASLLTPCFDFSGVANPAIEYYQHVYGYPYSFAFNLDIFVDGQWTNTITPTVSQPIGDKWVRNTLDLKAYAGKVVRFRFRAKCNGSALDWGIDDFKVWSHTPAAPSIDFIADPTTGPASMSVKFTDNSNNFPTSWSWSFPGGTPSTSTAQNPTVTYNAGGKYNVVLTATNAHGTTTKTKTEYITVNGNAYNMSNKTVTDCVGAIFDSGGATNSYNNNESFVFTIAPTNATSVTINTALWQMGSDDYLTLYNGTSTSAPVIGTYSGQFGIGGVVTPGTKTANSGAMTLKFTSSASGTSPGFKLTWTANGGSCGTEKPVAAFTSSKTSVVEGESIQFTDQSTKTPTSWAWSFPGGTPSSSTVQNPNITYNTPGTYAVTLTATNAGGNNVLTKNAYITVTPKITKFNMSNKTVTECSGTLYDSGGNTANYKNSENFTFVINPANADKVTMNFASWSVENSYDFLKIYNGTSASAPLLGSYSGTSPGTVVANSGAMTLVFTSDYSENRTGWEATWNCSKNTNPPVAAFTASSTNINKGGTVTFTDTSSNKPTAWAWSFEGGTPATSTAQNPTVTYNAVGTYKVTLTATNSFGSDAEVKTGFITVTDQPVEYNMSNKTVTDCKGRLYDAGGKSGNYSNDENYTFVINPTGATSITLTTNSWNVENNYDFLKIYNGTSASAPLLGSYSGTTPGTVTANSGAVTLVFTSDYMINQSGFDISWNATGASCGTTAAASPIAESSNTLTDPLSKKTDLDAKVFPVPVKNSVYITLNNTPASVYTISILDNLGRTVKSVKSNESRNAIDVSALKAGNYYIKVIVDSNVLLKRFIKE